MEIAAESKPSTAGDDNTAHILEGQNSWSLWRSQRIERAPGTCANPNPHNPDNGNIAWATC